MFSHILNILVYYAGVIAFGSFVGIAVRVYFAHRDQKKIKSYREEIVDSHTRILQLEDINKQLEKRVKELEKIYSYDHLFMN